LASIVKNAVGFDAQRNDQIEMVNLPFDQRDFEQDRQALDSFYTQDFFLDIARKVGYFLLIVFLFLYLKKKAKKLLKALGKLMPAPRPVVSQSRTQDMEMNSEEEEYTPPVVQEKRKPRLVDEMQKTAKGQPEEIARVIKTMMVE
jgi:flagellar biosynthesis/type III secretory pathway M-ring protein FliF/YscJ